MECPQSDFLKWLVQCNLYAACLASFLTTSCRGGRPRRVAIATVAVMLIQAFIPKQVIRWTKLFLYSGHLCSYFGICQHRSYYRSISNTPPSVSNPMFFLLPYGIASKLYWPSVFCYRYETPNSVCNLE
jgi:hypothetical protein